MNDLENAREFDVPQFIRDVTSGAGDGKISSSVASRSATNVTRALNALRSFETRLRDDWAGLLRAYVSLSPGAAQLFAPLWSAERHTGLCVSALDVLVRITRFARNNDDARMIANEVVKSGLVPITYVLRTSGNPALARKVLLLLTNVAHTHFILAKHIAARFHLHAVARTLTSPRSPATRAVFLGLIAAILAAADRDAARTLATRSHAALSCCANAVAHIAANPTFTRRADVAPAPSKRRKLDQPNNMQPRKTSAELDDAHVASAVRFVDAMRLHMLVCPPDVIRAAFDHKLLEQLVHAAVAANVDEEERTIDVSGTQPLRRWQLRKKAAKLLMQLANNRQALKPIVIARAISCARVGQSPHALAFITRFANMCPHVAAPLLQVGPYLPCRADASSAWLSNAAVVMVCARQLSRPVDTFVRSHFFDRTLKHSSPLVRHIGMLVLAMLCRVVRDTGTISRAQFLPDVAMLKVALPKFRADQTALQVLALYQQLIPTKVEAAKLDAVRTAVDLADGHIIEAEDTIRACLSYSRERTLSAIFQRKLIVKLLSSVTGETKHNLNSLLLVKDLVKATCLVGEDCDYELEVWLSCLAAQEEHRATCIEEFEDLVGKSWKQPYPLFDLVTEASNGANEKASLLTAAAFRRLKNRKGTTMSHFETYLLTVVTTLMSCDFIVGRDSTKSMARLKLDKAYAADVVVQDGRTNVGQVMSCLRSLNCESLASPALKEIAAIGEFLLCVYNEPSITEGELAALWAACCAGIGTAPIGTEFFKKHASRIVKHAAKSTVETLLRLVYVGHLQKLGATDIAMCMENLVEESMAWDERCVLLSVLLRSESLGRFCGKALSMAMKVLCDARFCMQKQEIISLLCDAISCAIQSCQTIPNGYVKEVLDCVLKNFEQLESGAEKEQLVAWARSVMRIIEAFVSHDDPTCLHLTAKFMDRLDATQMTSFARLGSLASDSYLTVLKTVPSSVRGAVQLIRNMVDEEQIWLRPTEYLPIICVVSSSTTRTENLHSLLLLNIAVGNAWKVTKEHGNMESILQSAYRLGHNIGSRISVKLAFEKLLEVGPCDNSGSATVWWSIACGLLTASSKSGLSQEEITKATRSLMKLTAQQIIEREDVGMEYAHMGPLGAISVMLDIAPFPTGYVKQHTEEFEDVKGFCEFMSSVFKHTGVPLLQSLRDSTMKEGGSYDVPKMRNLATVLQCVERTIGIQELAVNLSKFALHSFGEFSDCFLAIGDTTKRRHDELQEAISAVLRCFVRIVAVSVKCLQAIGMDTRSATALTKLEELFCNASFCFSASPSEFDRHVIEAMTRMKSCLQKDDLRRERGLPNKRSGYFAPLAANVIPILSAERMNATSTYVLQQILCGDQQMRFVFPPQELSLPYDPVFVLKCLRLGAEYAAYTKKTAVLDLSAMVNNGLLRVAISTIASNNENWRLQAYAALDALSRAVGPEYSHAKDSAATLFRERRHLAFMLRLLKESIDEPMKQVLPLFSSWFWHALRVMMRPVHGAHPTVMRYLLRQPLVDVNDCAGVVHLLRSTELGADVKATRLLALEVINDGIWSLQDHMVARRRRIYENVFMLAGSSLGIDATLRDRAVRILSHLPARLPGGQVAIQFCRMHAVSTWLVPQHGDSIEYRTAHLMLRIDALGAVAKWLPKEQAQYSKNFAETFRMIVDALESVEWPRLELDDMKRVVQCGEAIRRLAPEMTFQLIWLKQQVGDLSASVAEKESIGKSLVLLQKG